MRIVIACFKIFMLVVICLITVPLQALTLLFFNKTRYFFFVPYLFHRSLRRLFGIKLRVQGTIQKDKQTVFVGNHLSYLDIPLMGSILPAHFVSKDDVKSWPVLGLLATLSKTIFISRTPSQALQSIAQMNTALNQGSNLIVFPEGTSSRGLDVKPFKSSFFDIFIQSDAKETLYIQPFSIALVKTNDTLITKGEDLDLYAWYGDMDLKPHIWALAKSKGVELIVRFHAPLPVKSYDNRKTLSKDCYQIVSKGRNDMQKEYLGAPLDSLEKAP